jgi:hypothetical protein
MFEVNDYCNKKRQSDIEWQISPVFIRAPQSVPADNIRVQRDELRRKLAAFMEEMKKFMSDNGLTDDKFMKNLCDDIYVCFRTFDTRYGNMFCSARQTSQGAQRQYTVSNTIAVERQETVNLFRNGPPGLTRNRSIPRIPRIQRQTNAVVGFDLDNADADDIDLPILQHEVSGFDDTPYLTPQATQVMRFVSSTNNDDEESTQEF